MAARGYEFYLRVLKVSLTSERSDYMLYYSTTVPRNYNYNGNFICVFDCTIVNLATYRQFTNAA